MVKFLDLYGQYLSIKDEIDVAIARVIAHSAFIGGSEVSGFEKEFADYQHAQYCVGVGNGTDALEIALESLDLPKNSEIIVPANSFIASAEAVTRAGYRVVFADVDPDNYTLDVAEVERLISSKSSAIMAVHLYGCPCDMEALLSLAKRYHLKVIEDCAQAHGAEYKGRRVGTCGDVSAFSFYPGKNLGAYGDAGAILTNSETLAERCRMIANHGRLEKYNHKFEGRNSRLDGLQAAILSVKLKHLDGWIDRRRSIADLYIDGLGGLKGLVLPKVEPGIRHAFHLFVVRSKERDALAKHLSDCRIQTGVHYPISLPKLEAYAYVGQSNADFVANHFDSEILSLPMGEHLSDADIFTVIDAVSNFFIG